ncbi:hypothetical protein [Sphingomonas corticis]|uniref:DUF2384 domain-containing protein n=1 Tax=Sphingomonas corticis TaxID=2722791 RepID=A0ABX1CQR5_9SPHN|nr:hypothetical protein [Sphingomonas corticis]NJR79166.1 hypothetical protein [Sphingomonas corticis]
MREIATAEAQGLPQLMDMLTNVVVTLDAVGADSYSDVFVYVAGCRDGRPMGELSLERGDMWISTHADHRPTPGYVRANEVSDRRALLLADLVYLMWHWRWDSAEAARVLGVGAQTLDLWIGKAAQDDGETIPAVVAQRARRLVVVEHLRLIVGVEDAQAAAWVGDDRAAFGGRSIRDLLVDDGEVGFRRVLLLLLNQVAATSHTVH